MLHYLLLLIQIFARVSYRILRRSYKNFRKTVKSAYRERGAYLRRYERLIFAIWIIQVIATFMILLFLVYCGGLY